MEIRALGSASTLGSESIRLSLGTITKTASQQTKDCISLPDPTLLRGAPSTSILHNLGSIFKSSAGSATTYGLSEQVERLDDFVSHNWSSPALSKYFVLALRYNFNFAMVASAILSVFLFVLTSTGMLPILSPVNLEPPKESDVGPSFVRNVDKMPKSGVMMSSLVPPFFLLLVFFGNDIAGKCGQRYAPRIFLDKVCISQTDPALKAAGIKKLGAFLARSDGFSIVYTRQYLRKLWTVYEVACVLLLNPRASIYFLPSLLPKLVAVTVSVYWLLFLFGNICLFARVSFWIMVLAGIPISACIIGFCLMFLRYIARSESQISAACSEFSIRNAACFCEDDRALVQASVIGFMRDLAYVDQRDSDDHAMDAFDALVRQQLPRAIGERLGIVGIPYRYFTASIFFGFSMRRWDVLAVRMYMQESWRCLVIELVSILGYVFLFWPCLIAFLMFFMRRRAQLKGCWETGYRLVIAPPLIACTMFAFITFQLMHNHAQENDAACLVLSLFYAMVLVPATVQTFRPNAIRHLAEKLCRFSQHDGVDAADACRESGKSSSATYEVTSSHHCSMRDSSSSSVLLESKAATIPETIGLAEVPKSGCELEALNDFEWLHVSAAMVHELANEIGWRDGCSRVPSRESNAGCMNKCGESCEDVRDLRVCGQNRGEEDQRLADMSPPVPAERDSLSPLNERVTASYHASQRQSAHLLSDCICSAG